MAVAVSASERIPGFEREDGDDCEVNTSEGKDDGDVGERCEDVDGLSE